LGLLERIARLRKSTLYSKDLSSRICFDQAENKTANLQNEMAKNISKSDA
jgi:hypothetical protein